MIFSALFTGLATLSGIARAGLSPVMGWGNNPTNLDLLVYTPSKIAAKPAVILALHYCGGSGPAYAAMTRGYQAAAEKSGFIILYPSSKRDYNCWDVATNETLTHDGGGDSNGLANILRWTVTKYNADPAKLFVTGSYSGCMMSNIMSAVYPDLITAASCYSGVAAGCVAGSPGSSPQSADPACANGQHIKTGAAWAAQARAMFPAWNGSYPRFTTWHGTADTLVLYANLGEQIKEWTTLLGVRFTRNITDSPQSGYTQMVYGDGTKFVAFSAQGVGHTVPIHEDYDLKWFGLA